MGRIKSYPFTHILYLGIDDTVPPFDDDTVIVVTSDDDPNRGKLIPVNDTVYANEIMPTEDMINAWNIHDDHADGSDNNG
jgi:hypothetical protein